MFRIRHILLLLPRDPAADRGEAFWSAIDNLPPDLRGVFFVRFPSDQKDGTAHQNRNIRFLRMMAHIGSILLKQGLSPFLQPRPPLGERILESPAQAAPDRSGARTGCVPPPAHTEKEPTNHDLAFHDGWARFMTLYGSHLHLAYQRMYWDTLHQILRKGGT